MFWYGEALSPLEQVCIQSFVRQGHRIRLFTYTDVSVPEGVIVDDASEIMPADSVFTFDNSLAAFSDIFRFKLLFERGGWWVDTDILSLKPEVPDCDYYWAQEHPGRINGAVLRFPPRDPMCEKLLRLSQERSAELKRWGQIGPELLTEVLSNYAPPRLCGSTEDAYPVHWLETHFLWLPEFLGEVEERIEGASFLHLWNSIFARMGNSRAQAPFGSFLYKLYNVYKIPMQGDLEINSSREAICHYLSHQRKCSQIYSKLGRDPQRLFPLQKDRTGAYRAQVATSRS